MPLENKQQLALGKELNLLCIFSKGSLAEERAAASWLRAAAACVAA